jgi:tetratricopeptide (TPR) repeat protein
MKKCLSKKYARIVPLALAFAFALAAGKAAAQEGGALPQALAANMDSLRDAMYMSAAPETVESEAARLAAALRAASLPEPERALALARAEYYAARSWKEVDKKAKAIPHYEEAIVQARAALAAGETAARIIALMKPLSELCLLKDMAFLVANGPKVGQYAKRALALEPGYPAALIAIAASKAYPPAIFGGNPKEGLAEMEALLARQSGAVPGDGARLAKDELFDLRMCAGTACEKLGRKTEAAAWFRQALELYPGNAYAREQLRKAAP